MLSRNVWSLSEVVTVNWGRTFLHPYNRSNFCQVQIRNAFQGSRRRAATRRGPGFEPEPIEPIQIASKPLQARGLIKPLIFTVGVSAVSLAGCVIWEYENLRNHVGFFIQKNGSWKRFTTQYQGEPGPFKKWWNNLRDYEKVFYPILLANVLVFAAWRVKSWQPFMIKYFCSNPAGSAICLPMLLSTFSHYSPLHLAANMYVLYSFMPAAVSALGMEQFVAMYLSAGVVSSLTSSVYKVMMNQPGLSLGASGAIMAVLAFVCVQYPDTKLSIIFLPMYTFAAGTAIKVIMSMDLAGVVLGWKFFDHAAHLGGALFGMAWYNWIQAEVWGKRDQFVKYYHTLRKNDR